MFPEQKPRRRVSTDAVSESGAECKLDTKLRDLARVMASLASMEDGACPSGPLLEFEFESPSTHEVFQSNSVICSFISNSLKVSNQIGSKHYVTNSTVNLRVDV